MARHHSLWVLLPFAWMVGCQGTVGEAAPTTTGATVSTAAAPLTATTATATTPHKAFGHHGGPAAAFFHAAGNLDLTAAQRSSLDSLEATLQADEDAVHAAMTAFHADLSAGVKAGALDTAKLGADGTAVEAAMADHRAKQAAALVQLHDLLDPTQRTALVAAIRAKRAEHEAHETEWRAKQGPGEHADWQKRRLEKLTSDLSLDVAQQQRVTLILQQAKGEFHPGPMDAHREEMKQHDDAVLTAFAGSTFDAAQLQPPPPPQEAARGPMTGHLVTFVSQMLPILRADQREKFAASMDAEFHRGPAAGPGDEPVNAPVE